MGTSGSIAETNPIEIVAVWSNPFARYSYYLGIVQVNHRTPPVDIRPLSHLMAFIRTPYLMQNLTQDHFSCWALTENEYLTSLVMLYTSENAQVVLFEAVKRDVVWW